MSHNYFAKELDFHDQKGRTPLYIAAIHKNLEAVRELVRIGADVNTKCENGNTCLHRMMLFRDGDPKTEQIINILLNNGQITQKQMFSHQNYHEKTGIDYEMILDRNTAIIGQLNDMNKTALYYASTKRNQNFGWNNQISNVVCYDEVAKSSRKDSGGELEMKRLQKKVTEDEKNTRVQEDRRSRSKHPCSLTLDQQVNAKAIFNASRIMKTKNYHQRQLIDLVSTNPRNGLVNHAIYNRYQKLLKSQRIDQNTARPAVKDQESTIAVKISRTARAKEHFSVPGRPANSMRDQVGSSLKEIHKISKEQGRQLSEGRNYAQK